MAFLQHKIHEGNYKEQRLVGLVGMEGNTNSKPKLKMMRYMAGLWGRCRNWRGWWKSDVKRNVQWRQAWRWRVKAGVKDGELLASMKINKDAWRMKMEKTKTEKIHDKNATPWWFERWPWHCALILKNGFLKLFRAPFLKNENSFVKTCKSCFLISCFLVFLF
jgi:hypothetical protein